MNDQLDASGEDLLRTRELIKEHSDNREERGKAVYFRCGKGEGFNLDGSVRDEDGRVWAVRYRRNEQEDQPMIIADEIVARDNVKQIHRVYVSLSKLKTCDVTFPFAIADDEYLKVVTTGWKEMEPSSGEVAFAKKAVKWSADVMESHGGRKEIDSRKLQAEINSLESTSRRLEDLIVQKKEPRVGAQSSGYKI